MLKSLATILTVFLTGFALIYAEVPHGTVLVLSGGGSRGVAQIGVLKELERQNVKIDYIVGTSIGAVIGGLYSVGYSADELEDMFINADWDDIFSITNFYDRDKMFIDQKKYYDRKFINLWFDDFEFQMPQAISNGYKFSELLQNKILHSHYTYESNFDKLKIPFRAVSMDIVTGKAFIFRKGDLLTAIRASTTVPLRFTPILLDSMILIDGGPIANIPIKQAKAEFNPRYIISVNTTSDIFKYKDLDNPINIADQIISVLMLENANEAKDSSDYYIKPELHNVSNTDFSNIKDIIEQGKLATSKIDFSKLPKNKELKKGKSVHNNFVLNKIRVKGNNETDIDFILSEFGLDEGDKITADKLFNIWQRLYATELFSQVRLIPTKIDSNKVNLEIDVHEKGTQLILLGGRVDNERNTQGELDFIMENFMGTGARTLLGISGGARNQSINFSLSNPKVLNLPINFNLSGYYNNIIYRTYTKDIVSDSNYTRKLNGEYKVENYGFNIATGTTLDKIGKINFGFQLEKQRAYDLEENAEDFKTVSTFFIHTLIDSKNKSNFATEGTLIDLKFESNLLSLKNDVNFSKLQFVFDTYLSPVSSFTINPSLLLGLGDRTTPKAEFWGLGGQEMFYGMREYERIGRQIFLTSLEFRYKLPFELFFDTYTSFRYDIGGVWLQPEQIKFEDLRQGMGVGLSFDTPIGPASFALGNSFYFIKEPKSVAFGPLLFYFSIGINLQ